MEKVLILGGTLFIGRNMVERLLEIDEYEITLFNRQKSQSNLFQELNQIKGDRETDDVQQIAEKDWDYVIDLSCYYPDSLSQVIKQLNGNLKKYILISTCSAYDPDYQLILRDEQAAILACNGQQRTDRTKNTYGHRKAECERILKDSGLNYIILRPSLVYGTYDPTDRLYYWLYQTKKKEQLIIPDKGERLFSVTYVHDLVNTICAAMSTTITNKVYNVITITQISIAQILQAAKEFLGTDFSLINASPDFLKDNNIAQWSDMPLWLDSDCYTYSNQSLKSDLKVALSSMKISLEDTIRYYATLNWPEPQFGMPETRRQELIECLGK